MDSVCVNLSREYFWGSSTWYCYLPFYLHYCTTCQAVTISIFLLFSVLFWRHFLFEQIYVFVQHGTFFSHPWVWFLNVPYLFSLSSLQRREKNSLISLMLWRVWMCHLVAYWVLLKLWRLKSLKIMSAHLQTYATHCRYSHALDFLPLMDNNWLCFVDSDTDESHNLRRKLSSPCLLKLLNVQWRTVIQRTFLLLVALVATNVYRRWWGLCAQKEG